MLNYDAIVIGGGVSGLTSALLLAKRGLKTAVLESDAALMPLMRGFIRNGVHFETGFHYSFGLGEGEFGPYIFDRLGLELRPQPLLQDGYDEMRYMFGGAARVVKMAYGRDRLEGNLVRAFPEEKAGIQTYLDRVEAAIHNSAFLHIHINKTVNFNMMADSGETLKDVLDAAFRSEELKTILGVTTCLHGTPPSKMSFFLHSCAIGSMYNGAYGIDGGGAAIARAYTNAIRNAGIDVFLSAKAISIEESKEGGKKIIATQNDTFACDICVASIHPKSFMEIAPAKVFRDGYKARLHELEETPGLFMVYGLLSEKMRCDQSNIFLINRHTEEIYKTDEPSHSYCVNFSKTNPQAVSIYSIVSSDANIWNRNAPDYQAKKNAYADLIKEDMKKFLPEFADNIQYLDASTPATNYRYTGYHSAYGLMHDANKTKVLPVTRIQGLYLTGQSIVTPGFLGAIIASLYVDTLIR